MKPARRQKLLWTAIILLSLIGAWSALAHYLPQPDTAFVERTNPPPGREWYLQQMPRYQARPVMTALHVAPAFLFMLLAPLQLSRRVRDRRPALHRWNGRLLVAIGSILGPVGIAIGIVMPFGGPIELVVSSIIGIAFLLSLFMGVVRIRQKRIAEHRQWMLRMLAVGFVPVTMRGLMIAGVMLFGLQAPVIFGPTMLMGLVINVFVIELHLRRKRRIQQPGIAAAGISPA
jgi:hypothetical protein